MRGSRCPILSLTLGFHGSQYKPGDRVCDTVAQVREHRAGDRAVFVFNFAFKHVSTVVHFKVSMSYTHSRLEKKKNLKMHTHTHTAHASTQTVKDPAAGKDKIPLLHKHTLIHTHNHTDFQQLAWWQWPCMAGQPRPCSAIISTILLFRMQYGWEKHRRRNTQTVSRYKTKLLRVLPFFSLHNICTSEVKFKNLTPERKWWIITNSRVWLANIAIFFFVINININ